MNDPTKWIEVDNCTMRLRDDGKVDVYSPAGYRIVDFKDLTEKAKAALEKE